MPHAMSKDDAYAFLAEGTRTGKLATVRSNGAPHVVPVWFVIDGEDIVFNTHASTAKGKALLRDPRAAVVVDREEPPYAFVLVEGSVSISTARHELASVALRIARRYVSDADAAAVAAGNAVDGELVVRLHPEKMTSFT